MDLVAPNNQLRVRFSSLPYGLGIDNRVRVQIVLPDGSRMTASADAESNLIWATKGGENTFGTDEHGFVYGGLLTFDEAHAERVKGAIVDFMTKNDPKADIVAVFRFYRNHGVQEVLSDFFRDCVFISCFDSSNSVLTFYNDTKPDGSDPFNHFLSISHQGRLANSNDTTLDVATTLLYSDLLADVATEVFHSEDGDSAPWSFPSSELAGMSVTNAQVRWGTVMVSGIHQTLSMSVEEAKAAKQLMEKHKGRMVVAGHFCQ
ncbi:hypothetical protein EDB86DRAFT_3083441 [Lactarius hatsudake]|nr:hypothetical protein EDB86DRAFT_3083441 [Lactarius hatsudake]